MAEHEQTLCWRCKNIHRDKCSWFNPADPQPVPGWVAELRPKTMIGESYMVKECPNFDPEPKREAPPSDKAHIPGVLRNGCSWAAVITHKGKRYYLGTFTAYEAAVAARKAAEEAVARGEVPQHKKQRRKKPQRKEYPAGHCAGLRHRYNSWEVGITHNGRYFYLGSFKAKEEAIAARLAAEEAISRGEEPKRQPREPKCKETPVSKPARPRSHPGVYFRRGYWEARISYQGRVIHLGTFKTEEEAVAARKAAEKSAKRGMTPRASHRR